MKQTNLSAYVVILVAAIGIVYMAANVRSVDVGTMDHPHVVSLRP
jgi:hypothetical protein